MSDSPAEIAVTLTEAQKRVVKSGYLVMGRGYWPLRNALHPLGLFDDFGRLTTAGLAVKTELQKGKSDE